MTCVPLIPASCRSRTITSGLWCSTSRVTSVPSVVAPTTSMSGSLSSRARRPSSTMAWSSARSTLITGDSLPGERDGELGAAPRRAVDREPAAQHLHSVLDPPQPEVPAFDAHVHFARQHALGLEPAAVVGDGELDRRPAPRDADALARRPAVAVAVRERLLQDAVDRDLRRQGAVPEVGRHGQLHDLVGEGLVLDREALDDLAQRPALEAGRPKRPDEVADLPEGALEQPDRLAHALLRGRIRVR